MFRDYIDRGRVWLGTSFVRLGLRLVDFQVPEPVRDTVPPPRQPMVDDADDDDLSPMGVTLNPIARQMVEDGRTPEPKHVEEKEPLLEGSMAWRLAKQRGEL